MNLRRNLIISLAVSIAVHGLIVIFVATIVMVGASEVVSILKRGPSNVTITFEEPAQPEEVKAVTPEVKKESPPPVAVKKEPPPVPREEVSVKIAPPLPKPVEPRVVKQEIPKPIVISKSTSEAIITEEEYEMALYDELEEEFLHELEDSPAEPAVAKVPAQIAGENDGKSIQTFSEGESFVDIHPTYPLGARLRGEEGVVVVRVTVNSSGRAEKIEVMKSSGYASLDSSAISAMKKARFVAKNGGVVNGGKVTLPFRFKLLN